MCFFTHAAADGITVNIRIGLSGSIVSTPSLIAPLESSLILRLVHTFYIILYCSDLTSGC